MVKAPRPGFAKTRLTPPLSEPDSDLLRLREEVFSDETARSRAPETYGWFLTHDLPELQPA
jgi:hypothetical protein